MRLLVAVATCLIKLDMTQEYILVLVGRCCDRADL